MTQEGDPKWNQIITTLTEETRDGQIRWMTLTPEAEHTRGDETPKGPVYRYRVLGKVIEVYEYEYRIWVDEDTSHPAFAVAIELVNPNGGRWRIPVEISRKQWLLEEIRRGAVEASEFADQFLAGHRTLIKPQ